MLGRLPRVLTLLRDGGVAILCAAAALGGCGSHAPSAPPRAHGSPISILEDETLLHANPLGALQTFKALGVDRVRVYLPWSAIAPNATSSTRPGFDTSDPAAYPAAGW